MEALRVENISKYCNGVQVLKNINLTIESGEVVGLIGGNGAGKSTLMKIISNLINCSEGKVYICGYDVAKQREKALELMSCIIEGPSLYSNFTVKKQLELNAYLRNLTDVDLESSYEYLDKNISFKKRISKLSMGMKQDLALAQCFMNRSKLYILDEPINGLDFDNVLKFRKKVIDLKKQGCSVLIASHILNELEIVSDRFIFIKSGEIVKEVFNNKENIEQLYKEITDEKTVI